MSGPAIQIEELSKRYRIGETAFRYGRLTEALWQGMGRPFRRAPDRPSEPGHVWALRDVSLAVPEGAVLGIVGLNGAGKSTLLKIISRITPPTEGTLRLRGRVGSLLEVGTGFHPELNGRENVYLNGSILGMRKAEIDAKFDEIVAFSGIERFLDTPVKRYSTGMYVRLAFAVAAHLDTEILVVDEVLSVGDAEFQRRCLGKIGAVAHSGRTVLFVSHQLGAINQLCDRAVWLHHGSVRAIGRTEQVVAAYMGSGLSSSGRAEWAVDNRPAEQHIAFDFVRILQGDAGETDSLDIRNPFGIEIGYEILEALPGLRVGLRLSSADGTVLFMSMDRGGGADERFRRPPGRYSSACVVPGHLLNQGRFTITLMADVPNAGVRLLVDHAVSFDVVRTGGVSAGDLIPWDGVFLPALDWEVRSR